MNVSHALVRQVARLARLELGEHEVAGLTLELARILGHVEAVGSAEGGGASPLEATRRPHPLVAMATASDLRPDEPAEGLDRARDVLAAAPATDTLGAFFLVPKVLGDGP